ncbi:MAG: DUF4040 domain-containing protein [Proteobacteria bacterium]|nr:DUF4040 domain-containing protein [Pseudomonadota bacterium]
MIPLISAALFAFLLAVAVAVARTRDLFAAAMLTGIFSLLSAGLFTLLDAVDVAFTEAAVGAGISTLLILGTLSLTGSPEAPPRRSWAPLGVVALAGGALLYATLDMPAFGDPGAPAHLHVAPEYLADTPEDIGIPNVVTAVLASYRGYDTLGELVVILAAGVGVLLLVGSGDGGGGGERALGSESHVRMREKLVLRVVARRLVPFVLLFALYVQFHGDYGPGGGFQAGVVFAAGLILYGMIFGVDEVRRVVGPRAVEVGIAAGVLLFIGVGVASLLGGANFLDYSALDPHDPAHGRHLGILGIELGVGVTVASVMTAIYYGFAGRSRRA